MGKRVMPWTKCWKVIFSIYFASFLDFFCFFEKKKLLILNTNFILIKFLC